PKCSRAVRPWIWERRRPCRRVWVCFGASSLPARTPALPGGWICFHSILSFVPCRCCGLLHLCDRRCFFPGAGLAGARQHSTCEGRGPFSTRVNVLRYGAEVRRQRLAALHVGPGCVTGRRASAEKPANRVRSWSS